MVRVAWHYSSLISCIVGFGCTSSAEDGYHGGNDAIREAQQDIINGQVVTTNDRGVAVVTTSGVLCTGTMLNHLWLLTAKHCVETTAQTGATISLNGVVRTSEAIVLHPTRDVALIILSAAMPINGATSGFVLPIHPDSNGTLGGQILDCWGFGRNTFDSGAGVLRHALLEVVATSSSSLVFAPNASDQIQWKGDSGGTCFTTEGELRVTGVNSTASTSGSEVTSAVQVGPEAYRSWLLSLPFNEGPPLVADFDGDGRSDLVFAWNANPGLILQSAKLAAGAPSSRAADRLPDGAAIWNKGAPLVGDFNNDGRDDIAFAWYAGDGVGLQIRTKLSNGNGTYTPVTQQLSDGDGIWNKGAPLVGDFNNDGRDDIAFAWYAGDGVGLQIRTKLSNGNGTYTPVTQQLSDGDIIWNKGQPLVGDVNGDGRDDLIFALYAGDGVGLQIRTKLSNGNGTYTPVTQQLSDGDIIWNKGQPLVGDVNDDGRDDLIFAFYAGDGIGLQIRTKLSNGNGTYTPVTQQLPDGDVIWNRGGPKLTDTNGDGRADLVFAFERSGRIAIRIKRSVAGGFVASEAAL